MAAGSLWWAKKTKRHAKISVVRDFLLKQQGTVLKNYTRPSGKELGANVHTSWNDTPYKYVQDVIDVCVLMGITTLRGFEPMHYTATYWLDAAQAAGIKLIVQHPLDAVTNSTFISTLVAMEAGWPGVIIAMEGPNELDIFYSHSGIATDRLAGELFDAYMKRAQQTMWNLWVAQPTLAAWKILSPSIGHPNTSAPGGNAYAFIDPANRLGGLYHHITNLHCYPGQAAVVQADVDEAMASARTYTGTTPIWVTETGYNAPVDDFGLGNTESTAASRTTGLLNAFFTVPASPCAKVFWYQSIDDGRGQRWGAAR
jgi:hypothetical protein